MTRPANALAGGRGGDLAGASAMLVHPLLLKLRVGDSFAARLVKQPVEFWMLWRGAEKSFADRLLQRPTRLRKRSESDHGCQSASRWVLMISAYMLAAVMLVARL